MKEKEICDLEKVIVHDWLTNETNRNVLVKSLN
jgi:hypothetical protein